jgi:hypothetical protein
MGQIGPFIKFDESVNMSDPWRIHPLLLICLAEASKWCYQRGISLVVTSMIRGEIPGVSVSLTHREGRAFDLSVSGWTKNDIDDFVEWGNAHFGVIGALPIGGIDRVFAVYEDGIKRGTGPHIHCQINKCFALEDLI